MEKVEQPKNTDEKNSKRRSIDFVFEHNPELETIGTREEYSRYLETIFPDSLIRNPVYHSTHDEWYKTEKFNEEKMGETDQGYYGKGFYFYIHPSVFGYGDKLFLSLLNVKHPKFNIETHTVGKQILSGLTKEESRGIAVSWLQNQIQNFEKELESLKSGFIERHADIPRDADYEVYWESKRIERMQSLPLLVCEYQDQLDQIDALIEEYYSYDAFLSSNAIEDSGEIIMRDKNQIHILGSNADVEEFGKFMNSAAL